MGPLQDSKKMQEKEIARSRIPRLVLRPYLPKQKVSPSSESPFSEEESKDFNLTSSRSARTISSNSFCSDDTGCPSSQSVSPVKTPSDAGMSPMGFCTGSEDDYSHKRVSTGMYTDGSVQPTRYKKEPKSGLMKTGSEADFSSSSSTGSISAPEVHMSTASGGKKNSFSRKPPYRTETQKRGSRSTAESRVSHGRGHNSSSGKPVESPPANREKDLFSVLCRNQLSPINVHDAYGISSPSSSNSGSYKGSDTSPTLRRTMKYTSCGDNHGVKPPSPEQYLTPLQQKEVSIRHLKAKLKESQNTLEERETEIEDLKSQLARMREDWIEEECHRVEAQLALKEARKEIKQLKQFIETMKNSLAEKDKGIQKYFIDINIQNRKLETLLRSMELAQDGEFRDEQCLDYFCNSPGASLTESAIYDKMSEGLLMEDQASEEMADCDLLLNDDLANRDDLYDEVLMETRSDLGSLANLNSTKLQSTVCFEKEMDKVHSKWAQGSQWMEQAIQTDVVPYSLDLENLILKMFKPHTAHPVDRSSSIMRGLQAKCSGSTNLIDLTPDDPNVAILLSPDSLQNDIPTFSNRAMKELDFEGPLPRLPSRDAQHMCVVKRHWSDHFLTDFLAVAVPIIPTVLWALSSRRGYPDPVYNIGTMMRGCCLIALHTLRKTSYSPYN
ncbi:PREDICTED: syntabulin isoform X2 [Nanorana parkeri]|uniref:syntabulin isoform X2 n=1 Tax=Nanorana parkeri TaxID=125878 RepID=UPI000854EE5D|nr:PREDICTED: syntabulin isoform X2 [Nanorana parkeri]